MICGGMVKRYHCPWVPNSAPGCHTMKDFEQKNQLKMRPSKAPKAGPGGTGPTGPTNSSASASASASSASASTIAAKKKALGFDAFGLGDGYDQDFNENDLNFDDIENDRELLGELAGLGWTDQHEMEHSGAGNRSAAPRPAQKPAMMNAPAPTKANTTAAANNITNHMDFSLPDEFDENNVTFSEEDMNDPELLSQFKDLAGSADFDDTSADYSHTDNQSRVPASHNTTNDLISFDSPPQSKQPSMQYGSAGARAVGTGDDDDDESTNPFHQSQNTRTQARPAAGTRDDHMNDYTTAAAAPSMPAVPISDQISAAKANAIRLKKEGKKDEALMWLRKAKMLEMNGTATTVGSSSSSATAAGAGRPATTSNPAPAVQTSFFSGQPASASTFTAPVIGGGQGRDTFSLLEDALRNASDYALKVSKSSGSPCTHFNC
jgi:hypothetical protein